MDLNLSVAQVMAPAGVKTALGQGLRPSSPMTMPQVLNCVLHAATP
jgi:hypothetical protein